jgi:hypothetical protein
MFAATPQLAPLRLYLNDTKIRSHKLIESPAIPIGPSFITSEATPQVVCQA